MITCSVGITAHNEAANIGRLLRRLRNQTLTVVSPREIVVVASGCTDGTEAVVRAEMAHDPRLRLLVQEKREGKASAINYYIREQSEPVLVLCSADLAPAPDALEKLVAPFADPEVGLTCGRPVPVNDPATFMGFAAHMLWNLHHDINVHGGFKAGEMIAFRHVFRRIPQRTAVDEASIEPLVRGQGYRHLYVPDAIVGNKGPESVADFLRQRRRIHAGHLAVKQELGYTVSTMGVATILRALGRNLRWRPKALSWTAAVIGLEAYGRYLGWRDFKNRRDHSIWDMATSTKELAPNQEL